MVGVANEEIEFFRVVGTKQNLINLEEGVVASSKFTPFLTKREGKDFDRCVTLACKILRNGIARSMNKKEVI